MIKFGGIETTGTFGGWTLVDGDTSKLPQDIASGMDIAFEDRDEKIVPVYYFGYQLVNGMNHCFVCARERTQDGKTFNDYVTVVINIPPKVDGYKEAKLVKMEVADETILTEEVKKIFDAKIKPLTGAIHKPLLEIGKQIVKGTNYHIICESKAVYPDAKPYLTRIVLNQFGENSTIVSINVIKSSQSGFAV